MNILRAYLIAWLSLFCLAGMAYMVVGLLLYVFGPLRLNSMVGLYLLYLVTTSAVGGVVGEWMRKKENTALKNQEKLVKDLFEEWNKKEKV